MSSSSSTFWLGGGWECTPNNPLIFEHPDSRAPYSDKLPVSLSAAFIDLQSKQQLLFKLFKLRDKLIPFKHDAKTYKIFVELDQMLKSSGCKQMLVCDFSSHLMQDLIKTYFFRAWIPRLFLFFNDPRYDLVRMHQEAEALVSSLCESKSESTPSNFADKEFMREYLLNHFPNFPKTFCGPFDIIYPENFPKERYVICSSPKKVELGVEHTFHRVFTDDTGQPRVVCSRPSWSYPQKEEDPNMELFLRCGFLFFISPRGINIYDIKKTGWFELPFSFNVGSLNHFIMNANGIAVYDYQKNGWVGGSLHFVLLSSSASQLSAPFHSSLPALQQNSYFILPGGNVVFYDLSNKLAVWNPILDSRIDICSLPYPFVLNTCRIESNKILQDNKTIVSIPDFQIEQDYKKTTRWDHRNKRAIEINSLTAIPFVVIFLILEYEDSRLFLTSLLGMSLDCRKYFKSWVPDKEWIVSHPDPYPQLRYHFFNSIITEPETNRFLHFFYALARQENSIEFSPETLTKIRDSIRECNTDFTENTILNKKNNSLLLELNNLALYYVDHGRNKSNFLIKYAGIMENFLRDSKSRRVLIEECNAFLLPYLHQLEYINYNSIKLKYKLSGLKDLSELFRLIEEDLAEITRQTGNPEIANKHRTQILNLLNSNHCIDAAVNAETKSQNTLLTLCDPYDPWETLQIILGALYGHGATLLSTRDVSWVPTPTDEFYEPCAGMFSSLDRIDAAWMKTHHSKSLYSYWDKEFYSNRQALVSRYRA